MDINWFPGHMAKSLRLLEESLKLTDAVIYVLDARIPESCLNPEFDAILKDKPRLYILNKSDLANPQITSQWIKRFEGENSISLSMNATVLKNTAEIKSVLLKLVREKLDRKAGRGISYVPKLMVIGVSNCGKSTIINFLCGSGKAITGNKPGVTRGKQWVRIGDFADLLDTPGILPKKLEQDISGKHLAYVGCIKDEILDFGTLALELIKDLNSIDNEILIKRYNISNNGEPIDILTEIAFARGCKIKGGEADYERTAHILIDDFRKGRLGRISLERP